jgi:CBS domain-containing protein
VLDLVTRLWRRLAVGDATSIGALLDGFVAIGVEATGRRDAIVAVAAIPFDRGVARAGFVTLVDPARPIPPVSTAVHGIDDAAVAGAPRIAEVLPRFDAVCARRFVVGHDVGFDLALLEQARTAPAGVAPRLVIDTRRLAGAAGFRDTRREALASELGVSVAGRHTAGGDARMAGDLLLALLPVLRRRGVGTIGELLRFQRSAPSHD